MRQYMLPSKRLISSDITMDPGRAALLIRCSQQDADALRLQAQSEHRTVSGCLLNILERRLRIEEKFARGISGSFGEKGALDSRLSRPRTNRTALLLRCSTEEADRIRAAAWKRQMSISNFVVFSLQRHWEAVETIRLAANASSLRRPR